MAVTVIVKRERKVVNCAAGCTSTLGYEVSDLQTGTLPATRGFGEPEKYLICPVCGVRIVIVGTPIPLKT
jgi:hypothetical protein